MRSKPSSAKFFQLRSIINRRDPMELLSMGAPQDEYEPEVESVLEKLSNGISQEQVLEVIYSEFVRWFGEVPPMETFHSLAHDVHSWLTTPASSNSSV